MILLWDFFKNKLVPLNSSPVNYQYMRMRGIAHIMNLVVQDGLKFVEIFVKRVMDAIRYF